MSGIAGLSLSRSVVQRLAHAFDDVLGGDDAAGQIHLGRRQVNHLAFFTAVVFFSAVPVRIFCGATAFGRPVAASLSITNSQSGFSLATCSGVSLLPRTSFSSDCRADEAEGVIDEAETALGGVGADLTAGEQHHQPAPGGLPAV